MTDNPNCDGSGPHTAGEVRVYPLGAGGNLILCHHCWAHENRYRYNRQYNYMLGSKNVADDRKRAAENWPQVNWNEAEVYGAE